MSDNIVRTPIEQNEDNIIKKQVMNKTDDNIIRHQVLGIEEITPTLETLNVTENGQYTPEEGVDGFNVVNVNVSDTPAVIESLSITANGTYTAPSGVDGYSPITVDVQSEPETVILSNSDYSQQQNDLITGIKEYGGNNTYNSTDGFVDMIYNDNRGQYRHNWICNQTEKYNFEYEVELGDVVRGERTSNNYLFSFYENQNTTSGAECELFWDYQNEVWKIHHSSGTSIVTEIPTQSDIFANSITKLFIDNDYVSGTSTKNGFIYIQNENINNGDKLLLHDIGYPWHSRYLCIGNKGNNDGFYNIEVKKVKLTRKINHNFDENRDIESEV